MKLKIVMCFFILLFASSVFAAGTVVQSGPTKVAKKTYKIVFTCTADAADGSFPATATSGDIEGYVFLVETNPGATAPTDDYDITLTTEDGIDVMNGELVDRDTANSESAVPEVDGISMTYPVDGTLTLTITNNSVNSAITVVTVWYYI